MKSLFFMWRGLLLVSLVSCAAAYDDDDDEEGGMGSAMLVASAFAALVGIITLVWVVVPKATKEELQEKMDELFDSDDDSGGTSDLDSDTEARRKQRQRSKRGLPKKPKPGYNFLTGKTPSQKGGGCCSCWAPAPGAHKKKEKKRLARTVSRAFSTQSVSGGSKKALIVSVSYPGSKYALPGTIHDGRRMKQFLERRGFEVTWMTDDGESDSYLVPTNRNILDQIDQLVRNAGAGDIIWFQYSGHGTQLKDDDDDGSESDGKDECLVPSDALTRGASLMIRDDTLQDRLVVPLPKNATLICVIDACHSGTMLDLPYVWDGSSWGQCKEEECEGLQDAVCVYLSGCQDEQQSKELTWKNSSGDVTKRGGALTFAFLEIQDKYGDDVTFEQFLQVVREKVAERDQIPNLCCTHTMPMNTQFGAFFDGQIFDIVQNQSPDAHVTTDHNGDPAVFGPGGAGLEWDWPDADDIQEWATNWQRQWEQGDWGFS